MRGLTSSTAILAAGAALALFIGSPRLAAAQGGRTRVSYDVEFSVPGGRLDANCAASGTDVLVGTLVGLESTHPDSANEYVGLMERTTRISICGARRTATGTFVVCGMNIAGNGWYDVVLTIEEGQRDGYLQYLGNRAQWAPLLPQRPAGPFNTRVTGSCEAAEMAQIERDYDQGQTAGSPSGQPIEVPSLPPPGYPHTFPANPPQSIWDLRVLRRRP